MKIAMKRNTVSSKSFDMKGDDVFLQAVNYLWENSEEQLTIQV